MSRFTLRGLALFLVFAPAMLPGCTSSTEVHTPLELDVEIDPSRAQAGDTIEFFATAYNPTSERLQIGLECGPSLDVEVLTGPFSRISVLASNLGDDGAFTCPRHEYHFADPGETEWQVLHWEAAVPPGEYFAVVRVRCGEGRESECPRSRRVSFVVE